MAPLLLCTAVVLPALILNPSSLAQSPRRAALRHCAPCAAESTEEQGSTSDAPAVEVLAVGDGDVTVGKTTTLTKAEVAEVGNLVEDDEWLGLGTELAIVLRSAVRESLKGSMRDYLGKEDYKVRRTRHCRSPISQRKVLHASFLANSDRRLKQRNGRTYQKHGC